MLTFTTSRRTHLFSNAIVSQIRLSNSSLIHDLQERAQSSRPDPTEDAMESDQEGIHHGKKFVKGVFQDRIDMTAIFTNVSIETHSLSSRTENH